MRSSPHSTPIGAQFTVPSAATVVTIDSTIMGGLAHLLDRRRHERRALVVWPPPPRATQVVGRAVGARRQLVEPRRIAMQEPFDQRVAMVRRRGLGMKLHADDRM